MRYSKIGWDGMDMFKDRSDWIKNTWIMKLSKTRGW